MKPRHASLVLPTRFLGSHLDNATYGHMKAIVKEASGSSDVLNLLAPAQGAGFLACARV